MKSKFFILALITAAIAGNFISCTKETNAGSTPVVTELNLPATAYHYNSCISNDNVITLGRVLFYDTKLSTNNTIACGSCHKQSTAFSDNVKFSTGFESKLTKRNTPPIQNLQNSLNFIVNNGQSSGLSNSLFWDGRETFLPNMVLKPVLNHIEMGINSMDEIVNKVKATPYYKDLFEKAFPTEEINITNLAKALSSFTASIISSNTKFDNVSNQTATFSALEEQGRNLFFSKYNCNGCHQTQSLNGYEQGGGFVNIGLDGNYTDNGRGGITNNSGDNGKFKIPNLRNVTVTAPYMHDGRFTSLEQVLDHYSHNIKNHPNLDPRLVGANGMPIQMNISGQEKAAIIAFLGTLTDYSMITDVKFSNPFVVKK